MSFIGDLIGAKMQGDSAEDAAHLQYLAGQEANDLQREMWQTARRDYKPYRQAGVNALGQIQGLLQDPSTITNDPGYQFQFDEGMNALENSASARGSQFSGQQAKALQQYGQNFAGTKMNETYNRLAGLAGVGQQATGGTATAGMNYGNQAGQNMLGVGNAQAAAQIARGSAYGNMLNNWSAQGRQMLMGGMGGGGGGGFGTGSAYGNQDYGQYF